MTEVDLEELVAVVRTDLGERFRAKGAELRIVGPLPRLWGDRDRIGQLLVNLIGNGIKYNENQNPWVEIGAVNSAGADLPGGKHDGTLGDDAIIWRQATTELDRASVSRNNFSAFSDDQQAWQDDIRGYRGRPGDLRKNRPGTWWSNLGRERARGRRDVLHPATMRIVSIFVIYSLTD